MSAKSVWTLEDDKEESSQIVSKNVNLHSLVIQGCQVCRFSKPYPLQENILHHLTNDSYQNLVVCAAPRTGKTTAVIIAILNAYLKPFNHHTLSIITSPTYDIAELTFLTCQKLSTFCEDVAVYFVAKGKTLNKDRPKKKEIIVGTSDKISEYTRSSVIKLRTVLFLVIDDADCLGNPKKYLNDCKHMFDKLAPNCRSVLCTVSLTSEIKQFIDDYIYAPEKIIIRDTDFKIHPLKQIYLTYDSDKAQEDSLIYIITMRQFPGKVVIFAETKETIAKLGVVLHNGGIFSVSLTGTLSVSQKKKVLEDFVAGAIEVLVTTRSFVSVIPSAGISKLVHFDQVLDDKNKLNSEEYKRRECLVDKGKQGIVVCFVKAKWRNFLFEIKDKDILNERLFFDQKEVITTESLKTYLSQESDCKND